MHVLRKDNIHLPLSLVYGLYFCIIAASLMVCFFLSNIDYARKVQYLPNIVLTFLGIIFTFAIFLLLKEVASYFPRNFSFHLYAIAIIGMFFLFLQIYMVKNYYFITDWDAYTLMDCATLIANGQSASLHDFYFSLAPNNLFIVSIFSLIIKLSCAQSFVDGYFAIIVFQCILFYFTGIMLYHIVYLLKESKLLAFWAYAIYILLVGLSPWVSIPYSDSVGLFFPTAILWIYLQPTTSTVKNFFKYFLIGFLSIAGFKIKPQLLIIAIAIILVHLLLIVLKKEITIQHIKNISALLIGTFFALMISNTCIQSLPMETNPDLEFGITHYLMLGMNPDSKGVWAEEDLLYSLSFETKEERTQMNLLKTQERIKEMGLLGLLEQLLCKTLSNYNDGTFCWGLEGTFYSQLLPKENETVSTFLMNIYYNRDYNGRYYPVWSNFSHALWMSVLIFSLFSVFGKKQKNEAIIMLSIIGLTIFELVFEARARYLFCYVPLYIVLGTIGFSNLLQYLKHLKNTINHKDNKQNTFVA